MAHLNKLTGEDIAEAARSYLGVPFRHQGRNRLGVDCVGLLILIQIDLWGEDYDFNNYSVSVSPEILEGEIKRFCVRINKKEMKTGDVILFRLRSSPQHVGVYDGNDSFVHVHGVNGVMLQPLTDKWLNRIEKVYRWKALE